MTSDNYKLELVCGSGNKAKTIWEVLSEKKKKVIVIGIPMTYPPKPVNGILISGMDAPTVNASSVYPPQMAEGILKISPDYKTRLYLKGYLHNDKKRIKALNLITNSINATAKLVHHLMNNNQWDFFVVRFSSPDNVQHHYWSYFDKNHSKHNPKSPFILKDAINSIYRQLDRIIGELYKNINKDDTTFIIMSDHGAGPLADRAVFLNEWLRKNGLPL